MKYITTRKIDYYDQQLSAGEEVERLNEWRLSKDEQVWLATFKSSAGTIVLLNDEVKRV